MKVVAPKEMMKGSGLFLTLGRYFYVITPLLHSGKLYTFFKGVVDLSPVGELIMSEF